MGTAYAMAVGHFSKGEYKDANNFEDDLQIISTYIPYKPDDFSDNSTGATALSYTVAGTTGNISAANNSGLINNRTDLDYFKISSKNGGALDIVVKSTDTAESNLDVEVRLFDSKNTLLLTKATLHDKFFKNGISLSYTLTAGETYYIQVDGIGTGDPFTGWSDYNSMGPYAISGTVKGVDAVTALENSENEKPITVYPNPTNGELFFSRSVESVSVFDVNGKAVLTSQNTNSMNISNLNAGVYFISLQQEGQIAYHKIVKM